MRRLGTEVSWEFLNEQQRKFAEEWVRTHNFTKSLDHAGYEYTNAAALAKRLIRRNKAYIDYLEARALRTQLVSIEAVQHELVRLGYSNPLNYYTIDTDTGDLRPKTMGELTREDAAALKSWKTIPFRKKRADGTEYDIWVLTDIDLHDKRGPLQDLLKSLGGMPTGRPGEQPPTQPLGSGVDFSLLPPEDVAALDKLFKKAIAAMNKARDAQALPVTASRGVGGVQSGVAPASAALVPRLPSATKGNT